MATLIQNEINLEGMALTATALPNGRVHLGGVPGQSVTQVGSIVIAGTPGAQAGVAVPFIPGDVFTPSDVAGAVAAAINGSALNVQADPQSLDLDGRVTLTRVALSGATGVVLGSGVTGLKVQSLSQIVIRSEIVSNSYNLEYPGAPDEPGHRDIPVQSHTRRRIRTQVSRPGSTTSRRITGSTSATIR
jgi:hypothetical protein